MTIHNLLLRSSPPSSGNWNGWSWPRGDVIMTLDTLPLLEKCGEGAMALDTFPLLGKGREVVLVIDIFPLLEKGSGLGQRPFPSSGKRAGVVMFIDTIPLPIKERVIMVIEIFMLLGESIEWP